ncbi:branched-chain amino acid transporter permease [Corynebacterium vitaeruminis]|uniref:branched-chain amino acid transporter permease n=1 Tax=Corynebacterium vitaeruminis TaxID=38305 RepID=UPI0023EFEAED|nr:AzlD domain-containing protein [Corynebacterium vitaeruminis]
MTELLLASAGLPEGVRLSTVLGVLVPVAIVTVALRQIPFSAVRALQGSSLMGLLSKTMPVGVMVVLVVYTLNSTRTAPGGLGAALIAVAATIALHAWRKDASLSIIGGTAIYMVLVNLVF